MEVPRSQYSQRVHSLLLSPRFKSAPAAHSHGERQYDDGRILWWSGPQNCEEWGYEGPWTDSEKVMWEAAGVLLKGQKWGRLQEITPRELEFFLRDKNSQMALPEDDIKSFLVYWQDLQSVVLQWLQSGVSLQAYHYTLKVPFKELALRDKIHELKAFFLSDKLSPYYQRGGKLELIDVQECTVYLALETGDIPSGAFLDWLQIIAAETFSEPTLNLIPEGFESAGPKKIV